MGKVEEWKGSGAAAHMARDAGPKSEQHKELDCEEAWTLLGAEGRAEAGLGGLGVSTLLLTNGLAGGHGAVFVAWAHLGLGTTEANSRPLPRTREEVAWREGIVPA